MGFLKALGSIILKSAAIVTGFAPLAQATFPGASGTIQTVSRDLAQIADVITTTEVLGQALSQAGPQKLQAATPLVAQIILQSSMLARHEIADPLKFRAGAQKIADGMADVLNSLKDDIEPVKKVA